MLERLLVSKTRLRLLEEFLLQSNTEYHIRELARIVNDIPINVQKELQNLQAAGLLTHRRQGNMVLYKLNKDSPIAEDLKRIFLKTESIGKEILSVLHNGNKIRYALVYGSFAKGTESESSDIDMLIIGSINEDSILKSVQKIERRIGRTINFLLWTENEFLQKIRDNITLIREILKTPVIMISGDANEFKRTIKQRTS